MKFGQHAAPGDYAMVEVCDNGSGMDDSTLRRIFQPFFTTKSGGHGLGLAAVQGIVLGHRGSMAVDTTPGAGSRFRVWFPLAGPDSGGPDIAATPTTLKEDATSSVLPYEA
jgi:signal transduction histidine kinase